MSDIRCPKCGSPTQWSCHDDVGTAHCHEAGGTSRPYPKGWTPTCDWSGYIVRADDGVGVRLATEADAGRIAEHRRRMTGAL